MMSDWYNVECTAIADGIHGSGSDRYARISVILRPEPRDVDFPAGVLPIELLNWTESIAKLDFEVSIGEDENNKTWAEVVGAVVEFDPPAFSADVAAKANAAASDWWKTIWSEKGLQDAYRILMANKEATAAKVVSFSYSLLSDLAYARMASDLQIRTLAHEKRSALTELQGQARARAENPYDPSIRVGDALALLDRDTFAGVETGDSLTQAAAKQTHQERIDAIDDAIDDQFTAIRNAIDRMILETEEPDPSKTEPSPRVPWSPFFEDGEQLALASDRDLVLSDRYSAPIFGKPLKSLTALSSDSSAAALGLEAFRRISRRTANKQLLATTPTGAGEMLKRASRHIANLQAHPALRKFVRLILDIKVPLGSLPAAGQGVICVRAKSKANETMKEAFYYSDHQIATAYEIDQAINFFEPCPQWQFRKTLKLNKSLVPSLPLDKGLVQLNIGAEGGAVTRPRFRLEILDSITAQLSFDRSVTAMASAIRKGFSAKDSVVDEPGSRTRGIMLLDTESHVTTHIEEKRNEKASRFVPEADAVSLKYAEDLVDGYRLDVKATRKIGNRLNFSAVDRVLSYDVIQNAFEQHSKINPFAEYSSRDDGFIRSPVSVTPKTKGGKPDGVLAEVSEVLCTWTGANLALPTPVPKDEEGNEDKRLPTELPVIVTYDFPLDPGPILRSDFGYRLVLRARKLNGGSVTSQFAEGFPQHALGSGADPFFFSHVERTSAPLVLVPAGQRLSEPGKDEDQPSATTMIVKADSPDGPCVRMLVAPNVGFNIAEQQSQFDYRPSRPGGPIDAAAKKLARLHAERGTYLRLRQDPKDGGFPIFVNESGQKNGQAHLFEIVDPPTERPSKPYYVDRTLWEVGNLLKPTELTTAFDLSSTSASDIGFWKKDSTEYQDGFTQEGVVPVRLEVVAVKGSSKSRVIRAAEIQIGPAGRRVSVPVMRVEVGPADTLELEIWTKRLEHAGRVHPAIRLAEAFLGGSAVSKEVRMASLNEVTRLRILHPVQVPLAPPEILSLGATRCTAGDLKTLNGDLREDQPGAESTFAWGKIRVDRKSTGSVWADCRWIEFDPALYLRRTAVPEEVRFVEQTKALYEHSGHVEKGRLFEISTLPALTPLLGEDEASFRDRTDTIDLRHDDNGNLRPLAADFRSSRARKVLTRLIARSRFASPSSATDTYSNSLPSAPDDIFEQYAAAGKGPAPDGTAEFWLPATRAPAIPVLTRNYGMAYRRRFEDQLGLTAGERGQTLSHVYRCWLDNRWYDSGPFEKLAIICRGTATTLPGWLPPLLSKWGGDMTMRSAEPLGRAGELAPFLEPDQFVLDGNQDVDFGNEFIPSILRNIPLSSPTGGEMHNVDIALLTPQFHSGSGLWYCDIRLKGAPAYRVDLDLSLARYQHHAISGCHLSKPVAAGGFMLHQPWSFKATRSGEEVEIVVVGPAYVERAPMTRDLKSAVPTGVAQRAGSPYLTVELERIVDGSPLPVSGNDGRAVGTSSKFAKVDFSGPGVPEGSTRWTMRLRIPSDPIHRDALAVRISLASEHANSAAALGDVADGGFITLPEPMSAQLIIGD
jgi:hypothetical protein